MPNSLESRRGPWWRRITLLDALVLTLPPMALALWLFGASVMDYHRARQFDDWWSSSTSVRKFGWHRVRTALRAPKATQVEKHLSAEREDLPQLRLLVERADWDRIDDDVGGHWGEWIPAQVLDGGDLFDAELRFRGDGSAHWTTDKKSFTLKTKRSDLYKGHRTLAFSVKDVVPQWLVATLAGEFDLLAPEQQLVPVFLNDRFYGIHRFVEPIDEAFLRRHGRIPGNVFRADAAERGDYFKGLPREVFRNPHVWELAAEDGRPGAPGREALEQFLADLNGSSFADHERFLAWLDRGELARLLAYLLVAGDPFHMSGVHNQFWYQDPSAGTFHAIPWDVRLLDLRSPPQGANLNRFWRAALRDPRLWDATLRELAARVADPRFLESAERRAREGWERHRHAFELDTLRSGVIPPVGDPEQAVAVLRANLATLRGWTEDAEVRACVQPHGGAGLMLVVDVVVAGRAAVEARLEGGPGQRAPRVSMDADGDGVSSAADRDLGATWELGRLLPGVGGKAHELEPEAIAYRFFVSGFESDAISVRAVNALTDEPVEVQALAAGSALPSSSSWHPSRYERAATLPIELSGEVRLERDLEIEAGGSLAIAPGTAITLAPGVSILARGKVTALGTSEAPITIRGTDPGSPWGTLALLGEGASGSRFAHVRFHGGGGARLGAILCSGMVCVHGARDVAIEDCELSGNRRCDDALHAANSELEVMRCRFHDLEADGIDFDRSGGRIDGNTIEGAPADGIELEGSSPRVLRNGIARSGGRGLSIGEVSAPLVLGNDIAGASTGIEVSDASEPVILENRLDGCALGLVARRRNRSYATPGWPKVADLRYGKNDTDWSSENDAPRTRILPAQDRGSDDLPAGSELEWLLRWQGLRPVEGGDSPSFELVPPLAPIFEQRFQEGFADVANGWRADANASRVLQRGSLLEISLRSGRTRAGALHDWDLSDPSLESVLVLELAGENVENVRALVASAQGDVSAEIELPDDPETFIYRVIPLPPRRFEGLVLTAEPTSARSFLRLRGYRVLAWPAR